MKRKQIIDFLTLVLFFGIILSLTIYSGIGALIDSHGGKYKQEVKFSSAFYGDNNIQSFIRYVDYKFFAHSDEENVIIGKDGWIFETVNEKNGYNYLLDYVGGASFSDAELARISENIERERAYYENIGVEYLVIVIPSSMAVCEDKVPSFLGKRSDKTRLSMLTEYLATQSAYIDPTASLKSDYAIETPYNNTEDSINAYGAYSIYNTVMGRLSTKPGASMLRLNYNDIEFSVRMTDGKTAAVNAKLERIVKNRTVSLTDEMTGDYTVTRNENCLITEKKEFTGSTPTLMLELPAEWDRIQMMPLFSNTFDTVIYESGGVDLHSAVENHSPDIVVRMVREGELETLLK